ncbi:hypothetical protein ABZ836_24155, partial [Streptomyces sp. NPDC047130]
MTQPPEQPSRSSDDPLRKQDPQDAPPPGYTAPPEPPAEPEPAASAEPGRDATTPPGTVKNRPLTCPTSPVRGSTDHPWRASSG